MTAATTMTETITLTPMMTMMTATMMMTMMLASKMLEAAAVAATMVAYRHMKFAYLRFRRFRPESVALLIVNFVVRDAVDAVELNHDSITCVHVDD